MAEAGFRHRGAGEHGEVRKAGLRIRYPQQRCLLQALRQAVQAVLLLHGAYGRKLLLRGGELNIEWNRDENLIYMTGPAVTVFDGELLL